MEKIKKSKILFFNQVSKYIYFNHSKSHKNIAQLYESISTEHNFYLIMEYIEGGDLGDYIAQNVSLSENLSCYFFRQLISVIEYLNDMGITHRDLKPENILLDSAHKNIKVIDLAFLIIVPTQNYLKVLVEALVLQVQKCFQGNHI